MSTTLRLCDDTGSRHEVSFIKKTPGGKYLYGMEILRRGGKVALALSQGGKKKSICRELLEYGIRHQLVPKGTSYKDFVADYGQKIILIRHGKTNVYRAVWDVSDVPSAEKLLKGTFHEHKKKDWFLMQYSTTLGKSKWRPPASWTQWVEKHGPEGISKAAKKVGVVSLAAAAAAAGVLGGRSLYKHIQRRIQGFFDKIKEDKEKHQQEVKNLHNEVDRLKKAREDAISDLESVKNQAEKRIQAVESVREMHQNLSDSHKKELENLIEKDKQRAQWAQDIDKWAGEAAKKYDEKMEEIEEKEKELLLRFLGRVKEVKQESRKEYANLQKVNEELTNTIANYEEEKNLLHDQIENYKQNVENLTKEIENSSIDSLADQLERFSVSKK